MFLAFDPKHPAAIRIHHLPHWTQTGRTYFVTFRLADSLPRDFVICWKRDRCKWLSSHGIDPTVSDWISQLHMLPPSELRTYHRRFSHTMEKKLDSFHGSCLLRNDQYRKIVEHTLRNFHGQHYGIGSFVIMPNHVHLLVTPFNKNLKQILFSWKHWTAREINRLRGMKETIWQSESFDHLVRDEAHLNRFNKYIIRNPIKANLASGFTTGNGYHIQEMKH